MCHKGTVELYSSCTDWVKKFCELLLPTSNDKKKMLIKIAACQSRLHLALNNFSKIKNQIILLNFVVVYQSFI